MLLQFSFKNYKSFRDEAVLSLISGAETEHRENISDSGKNKALKSAAIFGANASGKSNVIEAMACAVAMVRESESIQLGVPLSRIVPFKLDGASSSKPTLFEFIFESDGVKYVYGFGATVEKIVEERLYAYYTSRPTTIFEREGDEYTFKSDKRQLEPLAGRNNPNRLFLATAAAWNYGRAKAPYLWFANGIDAYNENSWVEGCSPSAFLNDAGGAQKKFTTRLLKIADINISDYQANEIDIPLGQIEALKRDPIGRAILGNNPELLDSKAFSVVTMHAINENGGKVSLPLELDEESAGTQRLFFMSEHLKNAFETGKTLVVDEFEAGLHPMILEKIVKMFHDPDINKGNAQLVFTAHAVSLLDLDVFRRDQIFFTEKNAGTAVSELFSLDEFSVRKSENIRNGYLFGRYGAIPAILEGASPWE
jgi:AAA15 family ATPase/GTPase